MQPPAMKRLHSFVLEIRPQGSALAAEPQDGLHLGVLAAGVLPVCLG